MMTDKSIDPTKTSEETDIEPNLAKELNSVKSTLDKLIKKQTC